MTPAEIGAFRIQAAGRVAGPDVPIGDRLVLPERYFAIIVPDDPSLPVCNIGCAVERGHTVCVDLRCERREGGAPISGEILRQLPIAAYVRAATHAVTRRIAPAAEPRRRGPLREEDLRAIAGVYRSAVAAQEPPTRAVAARFGVARSTAGRWVTEARRRGALGKARPRMAGETKRERKRPGMKQAPTWPEYDYDPDARQGSTRGVKATMQLPGDPPDIAPLTVFLPHHHGFTKHTTRREAHRLIAKAVAVARENY